MKSKSKFTVKIPSEIYKGEVFIIAFFIVLNVMYTIFGNPPFPYVYFNNIIHFYSNSYFIIVDKKIKNCSKWQQNNR